MNANQKTLQKHHSHLSLEQRVLIAEKIRNGQSFRSIAFDLGKSPSTISREVQNHSITVKSQKLSCLNFNDCTRQNVCGKNPCAFQKGCKNCKVSCQKYCTDYIQVFCDKLNEPPYVCNGCKRLHNCRYEQRIYKPALAQQEYRSMLTERRNGFDLTCEQLVCINELVSPLIMKGQSPYHIKQTLGNSLPVSESTLRRMITGCELDARDIDLRNVVSRKPRKKTNHKLHMETISRLKTGHTYHDYLNYIKEHDVTAVQMDCVEGRKEDHAVLLTLHFPVFHMQLAYIMNEHTSSCVVQTLDMLEDVLGSELFKQVFPVIVTDNGHEFMDIPGMERSLTGGNRTKIFFCEPNRSDEKGACENNHKLIRYVIPKGTSLEPFFQADINRMMNHINSYSRKALYGNTPYGVAMKILPEDFFILLGLEIIPPLEVVLNPSLLVKKIV